MGPDLEFLVGLVPSPLNGSGRMQDLRKIRRNYFCSRRKMGLSAGVSRARHPRSGDGSPAFYSLGTFLDMLALQLPHL